MKRLLLCSAFIVFASFGTASASDVYISSDSKDSQITGVISDLHKDSLDLIVNGETVKVDLDEMNIDDVQTGLLKKGDSIRVMGEFDNEEFDAKSLILIESGQEEPAGIVVE